MNTHGLVLAALLLSACATSTSSPGAAPTDAGATAPGDDTGEPSPACAPTTPPSSGAIAAFGEDATGKQAWAFRSKDAGSVLSIEGYAAAGGPMSAKTHTIGADDVSYETCGLCVVLETGCKSAGGGVECDKTFMPVEGGTVSLSAVEMKADGALSGTLDELVLREVTIGRDGATTPVPNGETLCVSAHEFGATMTEAPGEEECSGHGHAHGDHCHCDDGYVPDPADAMRCIPE
ncbi:MAG: hypothetical protein KIS78_01935 [Labilithrix sp.]|nr:hypothetical protein [Labilithrix sp.]MCW5831200.1 hypothetical protein [Labilithrix sp.]